MVEELDFIHPGETTYLYLPLAHAFALTAQLASFEQGTTIVYYGGDTAEDPRGAGRDPAHLPAVGPADLREALHGGDEAPGAGRRRGPRALRPGGQARRRGAPAPRARRGGPGARCRRPSMQADAAAVRPRPRAVRRPDPPGGHRRGPDRARDPRVLLRLRRAGAGGLGHDRDDRGGHRGDARPLQVRDRRTADARRRGPDRRRGRRDPAARAQRLPRVLEATPRPPPRRWSTAGCTPATSASSTTRATSRSPAARRTSSSPRAARTSPRPTSRTTSSSRASSPRRSCTATAGPIRSR